MVRGCLAGIRDGGLPVVAAVGGACVGAGAALVGCCDLVVLAEEAFFSLPEIDVGVLGGTRHVQRLVGPMKTREMALTGRRVPAAEFYRLGGAAALVPRAELAATARALAAEIAAKSPLALRLSKESMNRVEDLPLDEGYRLEQDYTARVSRLDDAGEARRAYLDKREPQWTWRRNSRGSRGNRGPAGRRSGPPVAPPPPDELRCNVYGLQAQTVHSAPQSAPWRRGGSQRRGSQPRGGAGLTRRRASPCRRRSWRR